MLLTIGELAESLGVSVGTLRRWDRNGSLKPQLRTAGGHRRYFLKDALTALGAAPPAPTGRLVVGYARVSCSDQQSDLLRQRERLEKHLSAESNSLVISDLGSGLNFKKRGLHKLLGLVMAGQVERLVVTHKDRLLRFGFELFEQLVIAHGGRVEILEDVVGSEDAELAKDVLTIITVFSARLYGRRSRQTNKHAA